MNDLENLIEEIAEKYSTVEEPSKSFLGNKAMLEDFCSRSNIKNKMLTWEDIPKILHLCESLKTKWWFMYRTKEIGTQSFFETVLEQFNQQER